MYSGLCTNPSQLRTLALLLPFWPSEPGDTLAKPKGVGIRRRERSGAALRRPPAGAAAARVHQRVNRHANMQFLNLVRRLTRYLPGHSRAEDFS
eukprot:COSAG02_NODE_3480_length_6672_cov_13.215275_1_plen_93_part_10